MTQSEQNIPKGMKPFNLQDAIAGKPIVCRDGTPAKFLYYSEDVEPGWVVGVSRDRSLYGVSASGNYLSEGQHQADLFMAAEQDTVWINVYRDKSGEVFAGGTHPTADRAKDETIIIAGVLLETIVRTYDK